MHETGLMQSALERAAELAREHGAARVCRITLRVGALSSVVPDALRFAFDALSPDTMARDATLEIERSPALCFCDACEREFEPEDVVYSCPACGRVSRVIRRGTELELAQLEIE